MSTWPGAADVKMKQTLKIMTAGAPPAPTIMRNMEDIGADIIHTYGLTEVFGPTAFAPGSQGGKRCLLMKRQL